MAVQARRASRESGGRKAHCGPIATSHVVRPTATSIGHCRGNATPDFGKLVIELCGGGVSLAARACPSLCQQLTNVHRPLGKALGPAYNTPVHSALPLRRHEAAY